MGAPRKRGGLYRSDDAGASWTLMNTEPRVWGRGDDFAERPRRSRRTPDVVYAANTSTYRSNDGGRTLHRDQGRARRRRLPHDLDQPGEPRHHPDRRRSGRDDHGQRRPDLELLVQPADRARCFTSPPTIASRTGSTAASRKADRAGVVWRSDVRRRSRSASGTRSGSRSTATPRPTRCTRGSSSAAR